MYSSDLEILDVILQPQPADGSFSETGEDAPVRLASQGRAGVSNLASHPASRSAGWGCFETPSAAGSIPAVSQ